MKTKRLILSVFTVLILMTVIVSGTFALFTDTVNLKGNTVTAGSVDIDSTLTLTGTKELSETEYSIKNIDGSTTDMYFANPQGLTADNTRTVNFVENSIKMTNVIPGDYANFTLSIENKSSVAIKYTVMISVKDDTDAIKYFDTNMTTAVASDWTLMSTTETSAEKTFYIGMNPSMGNEAQLSNFEFDISVFAVQSNGTNDLVFVKTAEELTVNANLGKPIVLLNDLTADINLTTLTELNLNSKTLTGNLIIDDNAVVASGRSVLRNVSRNISIHSGKIVGKVAINVKNAVVNFTAELDGGKIISDGNSIIVNPLTAQEGLDKLQSDQTIVFSAGDYGKLEIRQSKYTSVAKTTNNLTIIPIKDLNKENGAYNYYRDLENINLTADKGAFFTDSITSKTGHIYSSNGITNIDPVREVDCVLTARSFYSYITIKNITFSNMNFIGENAKILFDYYQPKTSVDGLTIKNSSFDAGEKATPEIKKAAICLNTDFLDVFSNITVENTKIDNHHQGFYSQNPKNVSIINNLITNTTHNAIAIQSSQPSNLSPDTYYYFSGKILIVGNTIKNASDRAIRFGIGGKATINISNNKIENSVDTEKEVLKTAELKETTFSFKNNMYGGVAMADLEKQIGDDSITLIVKQNEDTTWQLITAADRIFNFPDEVVAV